MSLYFTAVGPTYRFSTVLQLCTLPHQDLKDCIATVVNRIASYNISPSMGDTSAGSIMGGSVRFLDCNIRNIRLVSRHSN